MLRPERHAGAGGTLLRAGGAQALERAALAIGRLDAALRGHPLQTAWSWRAGLDAVQRQAAADGRAIDPWALAALVAGARPRLAGEGRLLDRGLAFAAARHALGLWQWHVRPDPAQQRRIAAAAATLPKDGAAPLVIGAAQAVHAWLEQGGERAPLRAALARWWPRRGLLPVAAPLLTGARALHAGVPWAIEAWTPRWLVAVAEEAEAGLALLRRLEQGWRQAHAAVAGRRRNSHAPAAVELLAAAPLLSAAGLAAALAVSVRTATALLDELTTLGVAVEVTRRRKRRLWGLAGLAPLREATAAPRRPTPGRGRGRPRCRAEEAVEGEIEPLTVSWPAAALPPLDLQLACPELDRWLLEAELVIGRTRALLDAMAGGRGAASEASEDAPQGEPAADADGDGAREGGGERAAAVSGRVRPARCRGGALAGGGDRAIARTGGLRRRTGTIGVEELRAAWHLNKGRMCSNIATLVRRGGTAMTITTLSSREFNQDTSRAKKAAADGPVFITDRGQPAHVLLSIAAYQRLTGGQGSIIDRLGLPPGIEDAELEVRRRAIWPHRQTSADVPARYERRLGAAQGAGEQGRSQRDDVGPNRFHRQPLPVGDRRPGTGNRRAARRAPRSFQGSDAPRVAG